MRHVANWVVHAGDNHDRTGDERQSAVRDPRQEGRAGLRLRCHWTAARRSPALLGIGIGDTALPGIGARELSGIAPKDRITQAGRFVAFVGLDTHDEDVLWLDYDGGLAMHRVITTNPQERRLHRLNTPTASDNRISYGCINIPVKFYENVVRTTFDGTKGIVYVLPETKPPHAVFAMYPVKADEPEPGVVNANFRNPAK